MRILGQGIVNQAVDNREATLTAVPDDGWAFSAWSGADVPDTENPLTVTLDDVASITATFVPAVVVPGRDDRDGDGVADDVDNCVGFDNPFQTDTDQDGQGDECDDCPLDPDNDSDGDDVCGDVDNCPGVSNADQADADGDGVGDDCEDDRDSDLVGDADDNCPDVANTDQADLDSDGLGDACDVCPEFNSVDQSDGDGDGVGDDCDNCPEVANADQANADGDDLGDACDTGGGGGGGGLPTSVCGNNIKEAGEECDDGNLVSGDNCSDECLLENGTCGDGILALLFEQCDDGNNEAGDGCDADCMTERPQNDECVDAITAFDGDTEFSNIAATTDGPDEPGACEFNVGGTTQIDADVWFRYAATCNGTVLASLCGTDYDTELAVYEGVSCPPTQAPLGCSDDDCGAGTFDSRLTFPAVQGQSYTLRIGGFSIGSQGEGTLAIQCDEQPVCGAGAGDCFAAEGNGSRACDDATCCDTTCAVDPFCCDVIWDATCAAEAKGLCTGSFDACSISAGTCEAGNGGQGCSDESCCNSVCAIDPFCCADTWDEFCATEAAGICGFNCGTDGAPRNNACTDVAIPGTDLPVAGCSDETTCQDVCLGAPECCLEEWDQKCVCLADPDDSCCSAVCAEDAFCCDFEWDEACDVRAAELCSQ